MDLKELYQEIILDHGKNPRNLRKTENFNKDAKGHNPLCGDNVHIYLKLNENKKVEDISFEGHGCAISMASASIMTDLVKGKEEAEVKEIVNDFLDMIKEKEELQNKILNEDEKTKLMCLSGVKQYPMRVKCATLSWHTLTSAIDDFQKIVNTVNIYELGLIYDIKIKDKDVQVKMTLTTPNCPVAESLPKEVKDSIMELKEVNKVDLDLVWDPPWDKSMMSEAAKLELNL